MSTPTPVWGRYLELRPEELETIRAATPIAYLPWGALDWHGPHLPFGVDGIVAEELATQAVRRTGGVLLPVNWWPAARLPTSDTFSVRTSVLREFWSDLFDGLAARGWRVVVIISGYHNREHELSLIEMAEEAIAQHHVLVLAIPSLGLVDDSLLDRAGLWETSLMLSLRPDLVDLYALDDQEYHVQHEQPPIVGRDPRGTASASLGDTVIHLATERIVKVVAELVTSNDPAPLTAFYAQRRDRHRE